MLDVQENALIEKRKSDPLSRFQTMGDKSAELAIARPLKRSQGCFKPRFAKSRCFAILL